MDEPGALEPSLGVEMFDPISVPPVPAVPAGEWYNWPFLIIDGRHPSVGWEERSGRKGGKSFIVGRESLGGGTKVLARFPATESGWGDAWRFLVGRDRAFTIQIKQRLAERAAAQRSATELARLDQISQASVKRVTLLGGYFTETEIPVGQHYDLRFLDDRLLVMRAADWHPVLEIRYADIEEIEVGGPGLVSNLTRGRAVGLVMMLGELGEALALTDTKVQTVLKLRTPGGELFFLNNKVLPDALRIALSQPFSTIRDLRGGQAAQAKGMVAELKEIADLLDKGLITRDEFERLKAKLLAS
jgi:Short C-terminal domain